jgi:hypothetical protein
MVRSVFAPVERTGLRETVGEQTGVPARIARRNADALSTLPSLQTSPAKEAVREAFAQQPRNRESNLAVEPATVGSTGQAQSQPLMTEPRRSAPQLLNTSVPRQKAIEQAVNQAPAQLSAQSIPAVAAAAQGNPRGTRRETNQPDAVSANVIRVSIGRIDVRAEMPAPMPAPAPKQRPSGMSLDEYAKLRAEGKR